MLRARVSFSHHATKIIGRRYITAAEYLKTIEDHDSGPGGVNAFVSVNNPAQASAKSSVAGPLAGISIAVKDNICTSDLPTTCSSEMLKDFRPPYDATAVSLLRAAGADIIGKTNCDEFGMGSLNTYSSHGSVVNPFNASPSSDWRVREQRSAGGSSGGSAAAVANGMCFAALGTDTGGSIRLPASYCGVAGLKPSYGLISRWGVVSFADSLDCVGILASSTGAIKSVLDVVATPDSKDPTSVAQDLRSEASSLANARVENMQQATADRPLYGLKVGVPQEYFPTELDDTIKQRFHRTLATLRQLGAEIRPISLPSTQYALSAYYVIASAEASSNLARYDGIQYGSRQPTESEKPVASVAEAYSRTRSHAFGPEVIRRILLGTYALTADAFDNYFLQAQRVRNLVRADFDAAFRDPNVLSSVQSGMSLGTSKSRDDSSLISKRLAARLLNGVDVIVHPSAIRTAPLLPSSTASPSSPVEDSISSLDSYLQDVLTVPASLAGIPSLSIPMQGNEGFSDGDGMNGREWPVGVSISGQWGSEALLLHVGQALEETIVARN